MMKNNIYDWKFTFSFSHAVINDFLMPNIFVPMPCVSVPTDHMPPDLNCTRDYKYRRRAWVIRECSCTSRLRRFKNYCTYTFTIYMLQMSALRSVWNIIIMCPVVSSLQNIWKERIGWTTRYESLTEFPTNKNYHI